MSENYVKVSGNSEAVKARRVDIPTKDSIGIFHDDRYLYNARAPVYRRSSRSASLEREQQEAKENALLEHFHRHKGWYTKIVLQMLKIFLLILLFPFYAIGYKIPKWIFKLMVGKIFKPTYSLYALVSSAIEKQIGRFTNRVISFKDYWVGYGHCRCVRVRKAVSNVLYQTKDRIKKQLFVLTHVPQAVANKLKATALNIRHQWIEWKKKRLTNISRMFQWYKNDQLRVKLSLVQRVEYCQQKWIVFKNELSMPFRWLSGKCEAFRKLVLRDIWVAMWCEHVCLYKKIGLTIYSYWAVYYSPVLKFCVFCGLFVKKCQRTCADYLSKGSVFFQWLNLSTERIAERVSHWSQDRKKNLKKALFSLGQRWISQTAPPFRWILHKLSRKVSSRLLVWRQRIDKIKTFFQALSSWGHVRLTDLSQRSVQLRETAVSESLAKISLMSQISFEWLVWSRVSYRYAMQLIGEVFDDVCARLTRL